MTKKRLSLLLLFILGLSLFSCDEAVYVYADGHKCLLNEEAQVFELVEGYAPYREEARAATCDGLPITRIASQGFHGENMTSIVLGGTITSVGDHAFEACFGLTSFHGGEHITSFGYRAFATCRELESFTMITRYVDGRCFEDCNNLTTVTFPDTIRNIGADIFEKCPKIKFTVYDNAIYAEANGNPYYLLYKAESTDITSVTIHPDTKVIAGSAFANCRSLTSIDFGTGVRAISDWAFSGCSALTTITLPESMQFIGYNAFEGCESLNNVVLNSNLQSIGRECFSRCNNLVFYHYNGCKYLGNPNNQYVALIEAENKEMTEAVIHSSTRVIASYAFSECLTLKKVIIPDAVVEIGNRAFFCCKKLSSVTIGQAVTFIGTEAFSSCDALSSITIGDAVTHIEDYAFSGCKKLSKVTIGTSVSHIGSYAFYQCKSLKTVTNRSSLNIVAGASTFGGIALYAKSVKA